MNTRELMSQADESCCKNDISLNLDSIWETPKPQSQPQDGWKFLTSVISRSDAKHGRLT